LINARKNCVVRLTDKHAMNIHEQVDRIRQARELLAPLIDGSSEPQIESIVRSADTELHWALWNLGEPVAHRAELTPRSGSA
jgi:hypothetical protein